MTLGPGSSTDPIARTGVATTRIRFGLRQISLVAAALVTVVLAVLVLGPPGEDGLPFDPRSTAPDGLAGVVELLGESGVQVDIEISLPDDTSTRVFVPVDQLTTERRAEVEDFVTRGGTVVVAGDASPLHDLTPAGAPVSDVFGATTRAPACPELAEVGPVEHDAWAAMEVPDGAIACFTDDGDTAWLVSRSRGAGHVIAIGSATPFTNGWLAEADNAVLAAAVLGPGEEDRLVVIPRPEVGEGETPLIELVPAGVWRFLALILAAAVVGVLWRARRLGPPVEERLPPVLPSAELARSVAQLFQRSGDRDAAATRLRDDVRREVGRWLGVPAGTPDARVAELLAERTDVSVDDARTALLDGPVADDAALSHLAAAVVRVRDACHRPAVPSERADEPLGRSSP